MKFKHTILALVIVAVLGGILYFLNQQPEKPSRDEVPKVNLFSFTPDQVQEFTIDASGQAKAALRRAAAEPVKPEAVAAAKPTSKDGEVQKDSASKWEITAPEGVWSDSAAIQSFLEEIAGMQGAPLAGEAAPNWSGYGLDKPDKSYQFKLKDGKTITLDIGKENPGAYAHYARRNNAAPVLLIDNTDDKSLIEKSLFDMRDKRILPINLEQAKRIELHFTFGGEQASQAELAKAKQLGLPTKPARIIFSKQGENWDLDEPRVRTDHGVTNYLFTTLNGGTMRSLEEEKAESLAKYGLEHPQIRVDITTPGGSQSLLIGNKFKKGEEELYYAKNTVWPHVFTLLRTVYDQVNQDLDAYRERYLYGFEETSVRSVDIQGPGGALRFGHRGEDWYEAARPETQNKEVKIDTVKMQNFLNAIHSLRISNYTTDEPNRYATYGLDKPWMKTVVTYGDKNQQDTVLFARKDKKFYAARQGEPSIYELSPAEPDNLEAKLKELTTPPEDKNAAATPAEPAPAVSPAPAKK
jgi:uncharacterized protein DUF4340